MKAQWISWLSSFLIGLAILFVFAGGFFWITRPSEIIPTQLPCKECGLPKGAFEFDEEMYKKIGEPSLSLQQAPLALQLPDLRQQLVYYGKNGRPDAQEQNTLLHFTWGNGNKNVVSIPPKERGYLIFDRKSTPPRYAFSPNNEKTSLWIEAQPVDNEVEINVALENEKGERVVEPEAYAQFRLPEKEFIRFGGTTWELGSYRVDGTILARQRARWNGVDRFLENHGGAEYSNVEGRHRIDFGENDELYSVFVKIGDCLIWNQNRWVVVEPGKNSLGHPLLVIKKVDEKLMTLELWDVEGKGKITLNLLKTVEPWSGNHTQLLQSAFKFVGARTRTQCVFEISGQRMNLKPSDWMLMTPKGWKKLSTEDEIDQFVKRKITGALFVFEGVSRKDERQMMKGTLYSPARNESVAIEIPLQSSGTKTTNLKDATGANKDTKTAVEMTPHVKREIESTQQDLKVVPTSGTATRNPVTTR